MPRKTILIADDEPHLLELVRLRLEANGYHVLTVEDGQAALETARREHPDLVMLDILMPKLDGYAVCTQLKQDAQCQGIPVVLLTAKAQDSDERRGRDCGANAYVRKPFVAEELLTTIRTLIGACRESGRWT